jgi:hypothetical protein
MLGFYFSPFSDLYLFDGLGSILTIIFAWIVFTKFNVEGWKAIIPVYSTYTIAKMTNNEGEGKKYVKYFLITLLAYVLCFLFIGFGVGFEDALPAVSTEMYLVAVILAFVTLITLIITFVSYIRILNGLDRALGIETIFTLVLVLLPAVGWGILALSKKYNPLPPTPDKDNDFIDIPPEDVHEQDLDLTKDTDSAPDLDLTKDTSTEESNIEYDPLDK